MYDTPKLVYEQQNLQTEHLPQTPTFSVGRGDYLGEGRSAKANHQYDPLTDIQPSIELLDPNTGELKVAMVGVHKAIRMKLDGRHEPLTHN